MRILTEEQKKTITFFANSSLAEKFYWTGGTLLAHHYFNHRLSEDLDFFTDQKFTFEEVDDWARELKKAAKFSGYTYKKVYDRWEFLFENKKNLRIEFVYYNSDRATLEKRRKVNGIYIDSLKDIAANKLIALADRGEPKDLLDIYFLIKKGGFTPQKILSLTKLKYGATFSEDLFWSESLKALATLQEVEPFLLGSKRENIKLFLKVEDYFKEGSRKYLAKYIS